MGSRAGLVALAGLAGAIGCGGASTVEGLIVHPAPIPVRSYPKIWLAAGHLDYEEAIVEGLAAHLRGGPATVRRVDLDDLEPMRQAGAIPLATVVVILDVELTDRTRPEWTSHPETLCGPMGCYTTQRQYVYQMPVVEGRVTLTTYDGPTARVQQRATIREASEGRDYATLRQRVVTQIVSHLGRMVDQRRERVEVVLLTVDVPEVERAIEAIEGGDWTAGRRALERVMRSPEVRALPEEERARVLYDLGQARRFDTRVRTSTRERLGAARRALVRARQLDPDERYERAIAELDQQERSIGLVEAQRRAAAHNFSLGRTAVQIPEPPAAYRAPPDPAPAPP